MRIEFQNLFDREQAVIESSSVLGQGKESYG